jgi:putative ABC transport system substrate-binding protein
MTVTIGRRELLVALGGAAAWPLAARAQQGAVHPLIGVLSPLSAALAARNIAGFRSGLRDLGYLEGRNVTLALRYGDGAPERMTPLAQELVSLKPDVLMIGGARSGALAAQAAMRTIPIVIITTDDPVASGVAHSIARPGGNITGTWFDYDALVSKRLEFLKLAVPALAPIKASETMLTIPTATANRLNNCQRLYPSMTISRGLHPSWKGAVNSLYGPRDKSTLILSGRHYSTLAAVRM